MVFGLNPSFWRASFFSLKVPEIYKIAYLKTDKIKRSRIGKYTWKVSTGYDWLTQNRDNNMSGITSKLSESYKSFSIPQCISILPLPIFFKQNFLQFLNALPAILLHFTSFPHYFFRTLSYTVVVIPFTYLSSCFLVHFLLFFFTSALINSLYSCFYFHYYQVMVKLSNIFQTTMASCTHPLIHHNTIYQRLLFSTCILCPGPGKKLLMLEEYACTEHTPLSTMSNQVHQVLF